MGWEELVGRLQLKMQYLRTPFVAHVVRLVRPTETGCADGKQDDSERDEDGARCTSDLVADALDDSEASKDLFRANHAAKRRSQGQRVRKVVKEQTLNETAERLC